MDRMSGAVGGFSGAGASGGDGDDENKDTNENKNRSQSVDNDIRKRKSKTLPLSRKRASGSSQDGRPIELSWRRTLRQKLPSRLRKARSHGIPDPRPSPDNGNCVCTSYRRTEDHVLGPGTVFSASQGFVRINNSLLDFTKFNHDEYPTEDVDEVRYQRRVAEITAGIELANTTNTGLDDLSSNFSHQCTVTPVSRFPAPTESVDSSETIYSDYEVRNRNEVAPTVHTQIDYIHCLVPHLEKVTNCGYYWGVMDRYEAESLLDNKPEGTFLLRDSAQDEFLFSVSFRRYGRSLHARIEQWNHKFSFDSHDPAVFASDSVHGLIQHYKDPGSCLFFEPMLIYPLNRTHVFSLQNLCRAVICSNVCYDGINYLNLPKSLKEGLRYYHYKQKVRVRKFEISHV